MRPEIAAGATIRDGGDNHLLLDHQPCPKYRVVLMLNQPWLASNYASQDEANSVWAERLNSLAHDLGIPIDQACKDTSRLFYLPRHDKNGAKPEFVRLKGEACDLWSLPPAPSANVRDPQAANNSTSFGFQFPNFVEFAEE